MKKLLVLLFVLSEMVVQADVLEEIDMAVEKLGSFASLTVPDETDLYLVISPNKMNNIYISHRQNLQERSLLKILFRIIRR